MRRVTEILGDTERVPPSSNVLLAPLRPSRSGRAGPFDLTRPSGGARRETAPASDAQVYPDALAEHFGADHPAGLMFGLRRKKLSGSYFFFSAANRS